jgi:hypothetical protein
MVAARGGEQAAQTEVVLGVAGEGEGDQAFARNLGNANLPRPDQPVGWLQGHSHRVAAEFFEGQVRVQDLRGDLDHEGDLEIAVAEAAQHALRGGFVDLAAERGLGKVEGAATWVTLCSSATATK